MIEKGTREREKKDASQALEEGTSPPLDLDPNETIGADPNKTIGAELELDLPFAIQT